MEIERKVNLNKKIEDLHTGCTFKYNNNYYMSVSDEDDDSDRISAVHIGITDTGIIKEFKKGTEVTPIEFKLLEI